MVTLARALGRIISWFRLATTSSPPHVGQRPDVAAPRLLALQRRAQHKTSQAVCRGARLRASARLLAWTGSTAALPVV